MVIQQNSGIQMIESSKNLQNKKPILSKNITKPTGPSNNIY